MKKNPAIGSIVYFTAAGKQERGRVVRLDVAHCAVAIGKPYVDVVAVLAVESAHIVVPVVQLQEAA